MKDFDDFVKYCEKRGVNILTKVGMDDMINEYMQIIDGVEEKIRQADSRQFYVIREGNVLTVYAGVHNIPYHLASSYDYNYKIQFHPSMRATMRIGRNNISGYDSYKPVAVLNLGLDPEKFKDNVNTLFDFLIRHVSAVDDNTLFDYCATLSAIDSL